MANLRTSMDVAFHDFNIATPQTLHGCARSVPGEPAPLDGAHASKTPRIDQLSLLGQGFPLGVVPSYAPPLSSSSSSQKEFGSFALQSLSSGQVAEDWWIGLVGQLRPKKLLSSLKTEIFKRDRKFPAIKDVAKQFVDKSLYSIGLCSQLDLTSSTSLLLSLEKDGQRKDRRTRATLYHKLPEHDITLEAAWPELFIDHKGNYWDVPSSISLDCLSLVSDSGFRYRFGIHKNGGLPHSVDSADGLTPASLMPGVCAKAAFSYEKSKDLWRNRETKDDFIMKTEKGLFYRQPYDSRMKESYAAISGILGGTCEAWFGGKKKLIDMNIKRSTLGADFFASICYTIQHGKFRKPYGDLTRFDARLDIASASSLAKQFSNIFTKSSVSENLLASPRLNLILQQQVAGPLVFRVDSKVSLGSLRVEDVIYSLNYSLALLESGKIVAWYSPKRKEGMIELRVLDF